MIGSILRESSLQTYAKQYLRGLGWYVLNICPPVEAGTPDLICCCEGRFIGIELKAGRNKPTKLQEHRMKQIREAGGTTFVVWTRAQLREVING